MQTHYLQAKSACSWALVTTSVTSDAACLENEMKELKTAESTVYDTTAHLINPTQNSAKCGRRHQNLGQDIPTGMLLLLVEEDCLHFPSSNVPSIRSVRISMKHDHCWLSMSLKIAFVELGAPPRICGGYTCTGATELEPLQALIAPMATMP